MEYRNLLRVMLFKKSLRLYNRGRKIEFMQSDIMVFLALHLVGGVRGVGMSDLMAFLKKVGRGVVIQRLYDLVGTWQEEGWIIRDERKLYRLTPSGKNVLSELERRCRVTRWDK